MAAGRNSVSFSSMAWITSLTSIIVLLEKEALRPLGQGQRSGRLGRDLVSDCVDGGAGRVDLRHPQQVVRGVGGVQGPGVADAEGVSNGRRAGVGNLKLALCHLDAVDQVR